MKKLMKLIENLNTEDRIKALEKLVKESEAIINDPAYKKAHNLFMEASTLLSFEYNRRDLQK